MTVTVTGINYSTGAPYSANAAGDGVGDDTSVLQTALNTCGLINLPAGTFRITSTLSIPVLTGSGIVGAGSGSTTIKADFTNGTAVRIGTLSASSSDHSTIRGFKITRVGTASTDSYGLDVSRGSVLGSESADHVFVGNRTYPGSSGARNHREK